MKNKKNKTNFNMNMIVVGSSWDVAVNAVVNVTAAAVAASAAAVDLLNVWAEPNSTQAMRLGMGMGTNGNRTGLVWLNPSRYDINDLDGHLILS